MAADSTSKSNDVDINEALDNIFMSEQNILEENYQKGFETGKAQGNTEAYHLGYHRASEIGAELGYYFAILKRQQQNPSPHTSERISKLISTLLTKIEEFPRFNDPNVDIIGSVTEIRSKYRQICASIKLNSKFPEASTLSF
ncbi:protein LTO1 homolog [Culicoides brevitarsis]|uniref:protein LTO1 homolog n=1 Tax=Culicoides brevitarsis TaxID=469753 RepID=UPI00307C99CA